MKGQVGKDFPTLENLLPCLLSVFWIFFPFQFSIYLKSAYTDMLSLYPAVSHVNIELACIILPQISGR